SDAVYQVQVLSTFYSPEYGRGAGGVVNSITHSGTPEIHGTAFEYLRNSKLDARNFFDPGANPPAFKRNQFGATLTGPVRKDTTFFLASFEALRDRLSETQVDHFPDERARLGFPDASGSPAISIHPAVPRYLALYPLPNSTPLRDGIRENRSTVFLPTNEVFFTARLDHKLSDRDSLFVRYTFDDASSVGAADSAVFQTEANSRQQYATLVGTHIFSLSALTALRLGYTRPTNHEDSVGAIPGPELYFIPGAPKFGNINVSGLSNFGPGNGHPSKDITNTFQVASDTILQSGGHALKWGAQVHRYRWNSDANQGIGGQWNFNSLESFLQGGPTGTSVTAALPGSDKSHAYRQTLLGLYFQDTWALRSNLQLSLGFRYEYATLLTDKFRHTAYVPDPWHSPAALLGPFLKHNPSGRYVVPRVGITWSPGNRGDTVIGLGFGIYSDPFLRYVLFGGRDASAPYYQRGIRTNFDSRPFFPNAAAAVPRGGYDVRAMDYSHPNEPKVFRYTASLQQQFPQGWRFQATYVGTRANHLYRGYDATLFPHPITLPGGTLFFPDDCNEGTRFTSSLCQPGAGPINPAFSSGFGITSMDAQSFFNALQLSGGKRTASGISLQGSYSYSKSVDDSSIPSFESSQYGFERTLSRALSNFDVRHRISLNYFYPLPFGTGQRWWNSGALAKAFGGWRLGGILALRSGTPFMATVSVRTPGYLFAATQPDLLPGRTNNPISGVSSNCAGIEAGRKLGGPDLYFDPCSFAVPLPGTIGNAGRNTLISPWVLNVDVSVQREFNVDSKRRLQFRAEFFNVPNRANFGRALSGVFSGAFPGRPNPTAGIIKETITTSRQIQFALRFSF
ncbi:MAG: TonB-dependent receptor domain-containing protein, partial [Terriglobia bacterium]